MLMMMMMLMKPFLFIEGSSFFSKLRFAGFLVMKYTLKDTPRVSASVTHTTLPGELHK
jgi:hypothetical protein